MDIDIVTRIVVDILLVAQKFSNKVFTFLKQIIYMYVYILTFAYIRTVIFSRNNTVCFFGTIILYNSLTDIKLHLCVYL